MANPTVTISGRLASDPEFKSLQSGNLLKFRVITSDRFQVSPGEWADRDTSGWSVEAWSKLADVTNGLLKKGTAVVVTGVLKERSYDKEDGTKVYKVDLKATDIAVNVYSMEKITPKSDGHKALDPWGDTLAEVPF